MSIKVRLELGGEARDSAGHAVDFRPSTKLVCSGAGRTKQSFKDQCDINFIMGRYLRSGSVDHLATYGGKYGEVSPLSFHEAMNIVATSEQMFASLDSNLRKRFANDPAAFLKFVQDERNLPEMRLLGLAKPLREDLSPDELELERIRSVEARRAALVDPVPPLGGKPAVAG